MSRSNTPATASSYPQNLFEPTTIGDVDVPNRIFMAPLTRDRSLEDGTPHELAVTSTRSGPPPA